MIRGDESGLESTLQKASGQVKAASSSWASSLSSAGTALNKVGTSAQHFGRSLSTYVTLPIAAAAGVGVKMALDFDTAFVKVQALAGRTGQSLEQMKSHVLALAGTTAQAPTDLANALYFVASSGARAQDVMPILEASAKGAAAGLGDVATVAQTLTSVMNAYAGTGLSAASAMNIFTQAAISGKAEVTDFAQGLGPVIGVAAQAGVSLNDLAAAIAQATNLGLPFSRAVTSARYLIQSLGAVTPKSAKALSSIGLSAQDVIDTLAKPGGLETVLQTIAGRLDITSAKGRAAWYAIVGGARGAVLAADLVGEHVGQTNKIVGDLAASATKTSAVFEGAFQKMTARDAFQFQKAITDIKIGLIKLGTAILPVLTHEVLPAIVGVITWFANLSAGAKHTAAVVAVLAAALGPVIFILGSIIRLGGGVLKTVSAIGSFFSAINRLGTGGATSAATAQTEELAGSNDALAASLADVTAAAQAAAAALSELAGAQAEGVAASTTASRLYTTSAAGMVAAEGEIAAGGTEAAAGVSELAGAETEAALASRGFVAGAAGVVAAEGEIAAGGTAAAAGMAELGGAEALGGIGAAEGATGRLGASLSKLDNGLVSLGQRSVGVLGAVGGALSSPVVGLGLLAGAFIASGTAAHNFGSDLDAMRANLAKGLPAGQGIQNFERWGPTPADISRADAYNMALSSIQQQYLGGGFKKGIAGFFAGAGEFFRNIPTAISHAESPVTAEIDRRSKAITEAIAAHRVAIDEALSKPLSATLPTQGPQAGFANVEAWVAHMRGLEGVSDDAKVKIALLAGAFQGLTGKITPANQAAIDAYLAIGDADAATALWQKDVERATGVFERHLHAVLTDKAAYSDWASTIATATSGTKDQRDALAGAVQQLYLHHERLSAADADLLRAKLAGDDWAGAIALINSQLAASTGPFRTFDQWLGTIFKNRPKGKSPLHDLAASLSGDLQALDRLDPEKIWGTSIARVLAQVDAAGIKLSKPLIVRLRADIDSKSLAGAEDALTLLQNLLEGVPPKAAKAGASAKTMRDAWLRRLAEINSGVGEMSGKVDDLGRKHPKVTVEDNFDLVAARLAAINTEVDQVAGDYFIDYYIRTFGHAPSGSGSHLNQAVGGIRGVFASGAILAAQHGLIAQAPTVLVGEGQYATPFGRGAEAVLPLDSRGISILARALGMALSKAPATAAHVDVLKGFLAPQLKPMSLRAHDRLVSTSPGALVGERAASVPAPRHEPAPLDSRAAGVLAQAITGALAKSGSATSADNRPLVVFNNPVIYGWKDFQRIVDRALLELVNAGTR